MRRTLVCLAVLAIAGAQALEAQQCRTRGGRTECRSRSGNWTIVHDRSRSSGPGAQFGVRGGYDFEEDVGSAGAQVRLPLASSQLLLVPSADVFFTDDDDGETGAEWQLNADLVLRPADLGGLYGGVGVALLSRDPDPDDFDDDEEEAEVGYNLLLGLESGRIGGTSLRPFAEARWTGVDDYLPFRLVAGFNVPISGF